MLDTNIYIEAARSSMGAEALIRFYAAFLPFTYLHATVVQELLAGAVDTRRGRQIQEAYVTPFESRRRIVTPSYGAWTSSGEALATLVQKRLVSPGGFARSFLNDMLIAVSCRESGLTLITRNEADFQLIQKVVRFDFTTTWPAA